MYYIILNKGCIMYRKIVELLDKIASSLEIKGMVKEAEELDVISNTIEKEQAIVYPPELMRKWTGPKTHPVPRSPAKPAKIGEPFSVDPEELVQVLDNGKWVTMKAKDIKVKPTHS